MTRGPISHFIEEHYRHFNAAALVDAAKGYETHLTEGGKMMVTMAGAMSTAELGRSFAEMIRQGKVDIISCTGANLEEDLMNLVAHSHYKRVPHYRDLSPQDEWDLLEGGFNRVTDTCIPKKRLSADCRSTFMSFGKMPTPKASAIFRTNTCTKCCFRACWSSTMR
jgi:deoxyhypusine synthase